jgi:hypothetical protein
MSSAVNAGTPGAGGTAAGGAGAAGGNFTFTIAGGSDDLLTRWFRNQVRVLGGGNVQRAFGTGTA